MSTDQPVTSLLDNDLYAFTMSQAARHQCPGVDVTYAFVNRTTSVRLADWISEKELTARLRDMSGISIQADELDYVESIKIGDERVFTDDYLRFLKGVRLPTYRVEVRDGQYDIRMSGPWEERVFGTTPCISTVSELYGRAYEKRHGDTNWRIEGQRRLDEKIPRINVHPSIRMMEFGARRRRSREWQWHVGRQLRDRLLPGILIGTSNVAMAKDLELTPMGTMAHEWFSVITAKDSATDESLRKGHDNALRLWYAEYGKMLSILLTDTFTTAYCLREMTRQQAEDWEGFRQDSLDPLQYGQMIINFCKKHGIDSRTKKLVCSDGLDVDAMINILTHLEYQFKLLFGVGTYLTNDTGMQPLSLIMKPTEANGYPAVKLSDNTAKSMGASVERYVRVLGCRPTHNYTLHS